MRPADLPEPLQEKIVERDGHWVWTGSKNSSGHPNLTYQRKPWLAARLIYGLLVGDLAKRDRLWVDCERGVECVNPEHKIAMDVKEMLLLYPNAGLINSLKGQCPKCGGEYRWKSIIKTRRTKRYCRSCDYQSSKKWSEENREDYLAAQKKHYHTKKKLKGKEGRDGNPAK